MPSSGAGTIQCHQVVLVVEQVEASLFPHVLVWHMWPMHQVVPVAELVKVKPALFPHSGQMTHIPMASLINGSGLLHTDSIGLTSDTGELNVEHQGHIRGISVRCRSS
jgi:hypothetical protein